MFFWRQSKTGGKCPTIFILRGATGMSNNGCCGKWSNSRNFLNSLAGVIIFGISDNSRFILFNKLIAVYELSI